MHTYIGVGECKMCSACGVDVRSTKRHDSFHMDINAELDRLRERIAVLERDKALNLVTV